MVIVIPVGSPGPDGNVRDYPVHIDAYDILYESDLPLKTFSAIAAHYNAMAEKEKQPFRVRTDGNQLEFYTV